MNELATVFRLIMSTSGLLVVLALILTLRRRSREGRRLTGVLVGWWGLAGAAAVGVTHLLAGPIPQLVPVGLGLGLVVVGVGLATPAVRTAFDALEDGDWRLFMGARAVIGSLILGSAATGLFPTRFALEAGLGDLAVGGVALMLPTSLANGPRAPRLALFALGVADFLNVMRQIPTTVVPWLAESGSPGTSLVLPWVLVPALIALNAHGLRRALKASTARIEVDAATAPPMG
ncbi:MAG: hypothetical protein SFW67_19370 [Myxococcaceae bacterium]|nr:hypothetical protein [Myxococcaceae bacterium]